MRFQCSAGKRRCTVKDARSSVTHATAAGVVGLPLGGELAGLAPGDRDGFVAGFGLADIEDLPEAGLHLGLVVRGVLGDHVAGAVDQTVLAQVVGEGTVETRW